ncbi:MAG: NUDIX hydrolase [Planctomycetota bacterium]|nr:NUDIX hydrolase [Planctomycetota bacterium]MCX8038964.1 NUDIX hydrolase [Planctomycetota bacterium]MDW8372785.1 NUDIX hydrolase [Planctomycetota bacterium]
MPRPWRVLGSEQVVASPWLAVWRERVETGSGRVLDAFWRTRSPSWACVVAVTPEQQIVLVEQYRRGCDAVTRELPAGDCEDEAPAEAALRELAEETGYRARGAPLPLGVLWPEPARDSAVAHGFLVPVEAQPGARALDPAEEIAVVTVPAAALCRDPLAHGVRHAVHVACLLLAARHLG